jgi:hypothetical protein
VTSLLKSDDRNPEDLSTGRLHGEVGDGIGGALPLGTALPPVVGRKDAAANNIVDHRATPPPIDRVGRVVLSE